MEIVTKGGAHSYAELTRVLGVSEELLERMIEDLARMGYLKPVDARCQGECAGCPAAETCSIGGRSKVWTLTDKGSQFARGLQ